MIERFTLKPRFLPIRVDAPGVVLRISSDGDDRMGQKSKPKKIPRTSYKTSKKIPPRAGCSIPTISNGKIEDCEQFT